MQRTIVKDYSIVIMYKVRTKAEFGRPAPRRPFLRLSLSRAGICIPAPDEKSGLVCKHYGRHSVPARACGPAWRKNRLLFFVFFGAHSWGIV
jgi:hypothetical protein